MKKNKINTIEQGFLVFSEMLYWFYMQDLGMCKKGLIYDEEKYKKKLEYKMKNVFDQMNALFTKEEQIQLLKTLEKVEKVITEKTLKSIRYTGERTLEKDYLAISFNVSRGYCRRSNKKFEKRNRSCRDRKLSAIFSDMYA